VLHGFCGFIEKYARSNFSLQPSRWIHGAASNFSPTLKFCHIGLVHGDARRYGLAQQQISRTKVQIAIHVAKTRKVRVRQIGQQVPLIVTSDGIGQEAIRFSNASLYLDSGVFSCPVGSENSIGRRER